MARARTATPRKFEFSACYALSGGDFWPSLHKDMPIPLRLASRHMHPSRPSKVGLGVVLALCTLLDVSRLDGFGYDQQQQRWWLRLTSSTHPGVLYTLGGEPGAMYIDHTSYLTAVALAVDNLTLGAQDHGAAEFHQRWQRLLDALRTATHHAPPYTAAELRVASTVDACNDAMMAATDALYFSAQVRFPPTGPLTVSASAPPWTLPQQQAEYERWVLDPSGHRRAAAAAAPDLSDVDMSPLAQLRRVVRAGETALLYGMSSVGKSTLAREAALAEGRLFVQREGMPGLDERDLYGRLLPVVAQDGLEHITYVDGPVTRAYRGAAHGERMVLILDEIGRLDPLTATSLIGALDRVPGSHLKANAEIPASLRETIDPHQTYRVLKLPNGEVIAAPASWLAVIASTNFGQDYIQASQGIFDVALLSRFDQKIVLERPSSAQLQEWVALETGVPPAVARFMAQIAVYTAAHTAAHNGLLQFELVPRQCMAWARAALDLMGVGGLTWERAIAATAESTVIGHCCPRVDEGFLDPAAAQSLRDEIQRQLAVVGGQL